MCSPTFTQIPTQRISVLIFSLMVSVCFEVRVEAQVVQLPSIHTFSYSGSVLVPDSGTASLGSIGRSASRRSRGSGFGNGFGGAVSHSGASVTTTIIDHQEIDRQLLGSAAGGLAPPNASLAKDRTDEGKSLVRHARKMYRAGKVTASKVSYQMAIQLLDGRLQSLARAEYQRIFPNDETRVAGMR